MAIYLAILRKSLHIYIVWNKHIVLMLNLVVHIITTMLQSVNNTD